MRTFTLVFAFLFSFILVGQARATTGEEVHSKCRHLIDEGKLDSVSSGFCAGFVSGVIETQTWWQLRELSDSKRNQNVEHFCIPGTVTNDQIVKIFVKYLDDHPEKLHEPAVLLLLTSLHQAFPCKA